MLLFRRHCYHRTVAHDVPSFSLLVSIWMLPLGNALIKQFLGGSSHGSVAFLCILRTKAFVLGSPFSGGCAAALAGWCLPPEQWGTCWLTVYKTWGPCAPGSWCGPVLPGPLHVPCGGFSLGVSARKGGALASAAAVMNCPKSLTQESPFHPSWKTSLWGFLFTL